MWRSKNNFLCVWKFRYAFIGSILHNSFFFNQETVHTSRKHTVRDRHGQRDVWKERNNSSKDRLFVDKCTYVILRNRCTQTLVSFTIIKWILAHSNISTNKGQKQMCPAFPLLKDKEIQWFWCPAEDNQYRMYDQSWKNFKQTN